MTDRRIAADRLGSSWPLDTGWGSRGVVAGRLAITYRT